jgi:hypothetical protein
MPTISGIPGPYRFYFYSFDCMERPHVHVQRERSVCKFWLSPVVLADNHGMPPRALRAVRRIIFQWRIPMLEAWSEHCGES